MEFWDLVISLHKNLRTFKFLGFNVGSSGRVSLMKANSAKIIRMSSSYATVLIKNWSHFWWEPLSLYSVADCWPSVARPGNNIYTCISRHISSANAIVFPSSDNLYNLNYRCAEKAYDTNCTQKHRWLRNLSYSPDKHSCRITCIFIISACKPCTCNLKRKVNWRGFFREIVAHFYYKNF